MDIGSKKYWSFGWIKWKESCFGIIIRNMFRKINLNSSFGDIKFGVCRFSCILNSRIYKGDWLDF